MKIGESTSNIAAADVVQGSSDVVSAYTIRQDKRIVLMGCTTAFCTVQFLAAFLYVLRWAGMEMENLSGLVLMVLIGLGLGIVGGIVASRILVKAPPGSGHFGREGLALGRRNQDWKRDWDDERGEKLIAL